MMEGNVAQTRFDLHAGQLREEYIVAENLWYICLLGLLASVTGGS
jgi:hypothetical protein